MTLREQAMDKLDIMFLRIEATPEEIEAWRLFRAALSAPVPVPAPVPGEGCTCVEVGINSRTTSGLNGVESVTVGLSVSKDCPVHKHYLDENAPFGVRLSAPGQTKEVG
jgi:hypothetical protein